MSMDNLNIEKWQGKQIILVILAHPDDPEFFCGAMIHRWCELGHEVHYCLLTRGQKGTQDISMTAEHLAAIRMEEQRKAAHSLGVKSVEFLNYIDGEIVPDLQMRKEIVRVIRKWKPTILVTSDPLNYFPMDRRINHPDHRTAGQVVIDAAFPAAGSPVFFPEFVRDEKLEPHSVNEIWLSATSQPNLIVDLTDHFENKLAAIHFHTSQIGDDLEKFDSHMRERFVMDEESHKLVFREQFHRILLG